MKYLWTYGLLFGIVGERNHSCIFTPNFNEIEWTMLTSQHINEGGVKCQKWQYHSLDTPITHERNIVQRRESIHALPYGLLCGNNTPCEKGGNGVVTLFSSIFSLLPDCSSSFPLSIPQMDCIFDMYNSAVDIQFEKVICKARFGSFSHSSLYYSVVPKCCSMLLCHIASHGLS